MNLPHGFVMKLNYEINPMHCENIGMANGYLDKRKTFKFEHTQSFVSKVASFCTSLQHKSRFFRCSFVKNDATKLSICFGRCISSSILFLWFTSHQEKVFAKIISISCLYLIHHTNSVITVNDFVLYLIVGITNNFWSLRLHLVSSKHGVNKNSPYFQGETNYN